MTFFNKSYQPTLKNQFSGIYPQRTIELMKEESFAALSRPFIFRLLNYLNAQTAADLPKVANFIFESIPFENDPDGIQLIRSPERLFYDGFGNCVDYTTILGAAALALNAPATMRMVSYSSPEAFQHVFLMSGNQIFDLVAGQNQNGTAKYQKNRKMILGYTPEFLYHYDVIL